MNLYSEFNSKYPLNAIFGAEKKEHKKKENQVEITQQQREPYTILMNANSHKNFNWNFLHFDPNTSLTFRFTSAPFISNHLYPNGKSFDAYLEIVVFLFQYLLWIAEMVRKTKIGCYLYSMYVKTKWKQCTEKSFVAWGEQISFIIFILNYGSFRSADKKRNVTSRCCMSFEVVLD